MRKYLYIGIALITLISVLGLQNSAWAEIVVVDSYSNTPEINYNSNLAGITKWVFQSFTSLNQTTLTSAKGYLKRTAAFDSGNLYANIYAHTGTYGSTGTPTGFALATSTAVDVSTIPAHPSDYEWITFNFEGTNQITLNASTYYTLVLYTPDLDLELKKQIYIGLYDCYEDTEIEDCISAKHSGTFGEKSTGGWSKNFSDDFFFYVYGDDGGEVESPTPHSSLVASNASIIINNASVILP